jgi:hypothetical protein
MFPNPRLTMAVRYARAGYYVFRLNGKRPFKGSHGWKDGTLDTTQIEAWWTETPLANIAIACGASAIVVIDIDGPQAEEQFAKLEKRWGKLPETYEVRSGRKDGGRHLYLKIPHEIRSRRIGKVEAKCRGSYVVAPPSVHPDSGAEYAVTKMVPIATLPGRWLEELSSGKDGQDRTPPVKDPPPAFIQTNGNGHTTPPIETLPYTVDDRSRVEGCLRLLDPGMPRDEWIAVMMALHSLNWHDGPSGNDIGFDLAVRWSAGELNGGEMPKNYKGEQDCQKQWASFHHGGGIGIGTLFWMADLAAKRSDAERSPDEAKEKTKRSSNGHAQEGESGTAHSDGISTESAATTPAKDAVDRLNERHFMLRNVGGQCLIGEMIPNPLNTGLMLSLQGIQSFKTWYANDFIGKKTVANAWLSSPRRRQYEGIVMAPGLGEVLETGHLNLWKGFGVEPRPGHWPRMREHVERIVANGVSSAAEYVLRWAAWGLQNPGERAEVALVLRGGKGSGKGMFLRTLARLYGSHGIHIFNREHLVGKFNEHMRTCLYLFSDEAYWAGDKKAESVIKGLITEPSLILEKKFHDVVPWPNRMKIAMAANADWAVPVTADERRYAVYQVSDGYVRAGVISKEYFEKLQDEMDNGGLAAMLYDLLSLPVSGFHPRQVEAEMTALDEQKRESMYGLEEWWTELLEGAFVPGRINEYRPEFGVSEKLMDHVRETVPVLRDLSSHKLGRFLRKMGCMPHRAGTVPTNPRGWLFPALKEAREKWVRDYGRREWREEGDTWQ